MTLDDFDRAAAAVKLASDEAKKMTQRAYVMDCNLLLEAGIEHETHLGYWCEPPWHSVSERTPTHDEFVLAEFGPGPTRGVKATLRFVGGDWQYMSGESAKPYGEVARWQELPTYHATSREAFAAKLAEAKP